MANESPFIVALRLQPFDPDTERALHSAGLDPTRPMVRRQKGEPRTLADGLNIVMPVELERQTFAELLPVLLRWLSGIKPIIDELAQRVDSATTEVDIAVCGGDEIAIRTLRFPPSALEWFARARMELAISVFHDR